MSSRWMKVNEVLFLLDSSVIIGEWSLRSGGVSAGEESEDAGDGGEEVRALGLGRREERSVG